MNNERTQSIRLAQSRDLIAASSQEGLQSALQSRIAQAIEKLLRNLKAGSADSNVEKPKKISVQVVLRIPINDTEFETSTLKYQLQLSEKQQRYFLDPITNLSQVVSKHLADSVTGKCEVEIDIKTNQASDETASISESFSVTQEKPIVSETILETSIDEESQDEYSEMGIVPIGFEGKSADEVAVFNDIVIVLSNAVKKLKEKNLISNRQIVELSLYHHGTRQRYVTFYALAIYLPFNDQPSFLINTQQEITDLLQSYLELTKSQSMHDRSLLVKVSVNATKQ